VRWQGVGEASGGFSSAGAPAPADSMGSSSDGGASWSGSTAAFPARSAQGKEPRGLAEVRGAVLEGKEAGVSGERMTTKTGLLWIRLSPSLSAARGGEGQRSHAREWDVEERSGVRGRVARGGGFYSDGGLASSCTGVEAEWAGEGRSTARFSSRLVSDRCHHAQKNRAREERGRFGLGFW
jgi:hypothetical protein